MLTYTHAVWSSADLQVFFASPVLSFMWQTPPSHFFPQSLLPLFPWPLASFPTHINTQLRPGTAVPDPCHHHKAANLFPWQYDWQVLRWMPQVGLSCAVSVGKKGWMQQNKRTQTHTHIAWDHSAVQSVWGPYLGCQFCCDVSFMSPLCGLLLKHVDRSIIQAFGRFPYIHRLLITHVNAPIGLWQVLRITTWIMRL